MPRSNSITLTMADGSTHVIVGGVREFALTDRAFAHLNAVIQNKRLRPAPRLDRELGWLRSAVKIEELDGAFTELQAFIVGRLDKIETDVHRMRRGQNE